ncbi:NF-X1-type zinc finger NFXL1 [Brachionus plicatilis]|uniref:NF-X1-type zinc finger NFXL1 n=1 Tax=Brachionus plicatilis TaxID=10195 RepID=A0A3M7RYM0_BRAPC|nr:NF-X1-type zinc finger NFXL1 [Brachionus plicatilis]
MVTYDSNDQDTSLNIILNKFKELNDSQDLGNTEQYLIDAFNPDSNICLICIEQVENKQPIWSCDGCFAQYHIVCIQNWIRDGSYQTIKQNLNSDSILQKEIPWNCPKCRKEYSKESYPSIYHCYCKKVKNPDFDPWGVPHSCNMRCDKPKQCGHPCLMLCHPGPCPPCPKMVKNTCHCSKSSPVTRRCCNKFWQCDKKCNKLLTCKQHLCETICHPGDCGQCNKTSLQFCKCKKKRKETSCTQTIWECGQKCLKPYTCGYHKCEFICHPGECGECPRSLIRTCPCGKSTSKKPCNIDIPTCGDTCDKNLSCNIHKCANRCHYGPCEQCRQLVTKKCRCGSKEKLLPCHMEFTCELKCSRLKNCGKHKCNKKCCDGNCSSCEQICNKMLSCKNHKCQSMCHSGNCYPCPIMEEIYCPCGKSKIKVPCMKRKTNLKVPCRQLCKQPAKCHHEKIQNHKCHYGDCPPCQLTCGKKHPCNHICQNVCHTAVLTEIVENKDREGPWIPLKIRKEILNIECKPCVYPVPVECFGAHEISDLPCHSAKPFNCGRKCGRMLSCTRHKCEYECHLILEKDKANKKEASSTCEECSKNCELVRPKGCTHECSLGACHSGECPNCKHLLKMKCHCKGNFIYVECHKWNNSCQKEQINLASCRVPCSNLLKCGHNCSFVCHFGKCSEEDNCLEKVVIKCKCKSIKKNFACNKIKTDSSIIVTEKGFVLRCGDKCKSKIVQKTESNDTQKNHRYETLRGRKVGRPAVKWRSRITKELIKMGMTWGEARVKTKDRLEWKSKPKDSNHIEIEKTCFCNRVSRNIDRLNKQMSHSILNQDLIDDFDENEAQNVNRFNSSEETSIYDLGEFDQETD